MQTIKTSIACTTFTATLLLNEQNLRSPNYCKTLLEWAAFTHKSTSRAASLCESGLLAWVRISGTGNYFLLLKKKKKAWKGKLRRKKKSYLKIEFLGFHKSIKFYLRRPQLQNVGKHLKLFCHKRSLQKLRYSQTKFIQHSGLCPKAPKARKLKLRLDTPSLTYTRHKSACLSRMSAFILWISWAGQVCKMLPSFLFSAAPGMTCCLPSLSSMHIFMIKL